MGACLVCVRVDVYKGNFIFKATHVLDTGVYDEGFF